MELKKCKKFSKTIRIPKTLYLYYEKRAKLRGVSLTTVLVEALSYYYVEDSTLIDDFINISNSFKKAYTNKKPKEVVFVVSDAKR